MERSKRDLEALVTSQKEQLTRYEKRLKDVVTAYKGLLKEKEALETSLSALTTTNGNSTASVQESAQQQQQQQQQQHNTTKNVPNETDIINETSIQQQLRKNDVVDSNIDTKVDNQLQTQIMTLMNSLATLSAEKSRMEASFQADKKQLRAQLAQKEQNIAELNIKMKEIEEISKSKVNDVKAKWIIECQEREKETSNQMLMIRELQKLYGDERHLKENIEMQLNNFKTQFASNEAENERLHELQTQLKEARAQLKQYQSNKKYDGINDTDELLESAAVLKQVQQEMQQLKEQHAIAIKGEQRRALLAEEQSRKQAALHEDRVANLEARLAELSNTVGSYDRLRQQDQDSIQTLKKKLQALELNGDAVGQQQKQQQQQHVRDNDNEKRLKRRSIAAHDIVAIVDEIKRLKKLLMDENAHALNPIDLNKVFTIKADHVQCQEELKRTQQQCEDAKTKASELQENFQVQKSHIATLQDKVKVLNRNIDEQELELKQQQDKLRQTVNDERAKWQEALAELENECRCKVNDMEQQLQKQRQRSLQLLDEKEQEIKTLQTSFEIFHNMPMNAYATTGVTNHELNTTSSDGESNDGTGIETQIKKRSNSIKSTKKLSVSENCHMLHYANEIARKDIEIAGLRKAKYAAETSLRKSILEKVTAQEELNDKIAFLEEQVDRLERCKTREGANLEYLKNVIISYILTKDVDGKRHMVNAISAVLQFTPNEIQLINAAFHKK